MAVFGIGVYEAGEYTCRDETGKLTKGYAAWKHMIERCYSPAYQSKFPTYAGCSVDEQFLNYQRFMQWAAKEIGYSAEGSCLDKDLLVGGNKVYSQETCTFLPPQINGVLNKHKARRGELPIGVSLNNDKYMATVCIDGSNKNLGRFLLPEDAFQAYKTAKEAYIKDLAVRYKDSISGVAFAALMAYTVNITD